MADAKIKLGVDITELQAGLARGRASVNSWASGVAGELKGGLAGALGGAAIAAALKGLVTEFADISDAADRAGVSVRFLLGIKDDAEQTGASLETAAKSVKKFLIELNDPKTAEKMGGVLKALGTDVDTLRSAAPEELFKVLADAIAGAGSQADKLAILGVLLGDTGGKFESLLPLLEKVGKDGFRPVSDEMVEATKQAAALDDSFDETVSMVKQNVLPLFINFIKVMKLVAVTIKTNLALPFKAIGTIIGGVATNAEALGKILLGAVTLDKAKIEEGVNLMKNNFVQTFDNIVSDAKAGAGEIAEAFNDIGDITAKPASAEVAVNDKLKEQLDLLKKKDQITKDIADNEAAAAKRTAAWVKEQESELKTLEEKLAAIEGKDSAAAPKSISDLNKQLSDLMALKAGGGGVIASSATQMGFGGRAVAGVQQSAVERQIAETNKLLAERKTDAAEVKALMQKLLDVIE